MRADRHEEARDPKTENRSTGALLSDLANELSALFRGELQLFRAELGEKVNQAFTAVGLIVAGVVLLLPGLNAVMVFVIGLIVALGLAEGWAALIAGLVVAAVGYGLVKGGTSKLEAARLRPDRTVPSIREDTKAAKEVAR